MPDTLVLYRDESDTGLDLSSFVDVEEGGIDPGDAAIREPVWVDAATSTGYGAGLAGERLANRPFLVALLLSGATRDALLARFREIQERLDGPRCFLEWRPQDATSSTWYRVRYGRLLGSERYDVRRERARVAKRLLQLDCSPYGEGNRRRASNLSTTLASGLGWASSLAPSNPAVVSVASVGGDVPAAMRLAFSHGAGPTLARWSGFAWGLTYQPSYLPAFLTGGASLLGARDGTAYGPTAYLAASGIVGGATNGAAWATGLAAQFLATYAVSGAAPPYYTIVNSVKGSMASYGISAPVAGRYRAYLAARYRSASHPVRVRLRDPYSNIGPVATIGGAVDGASAFRWYDMGDVQVGPTSLAFAISALVSSGMATVVSASPALNVAGLALIPRDVQFGVFQHTSYDELATLAWIVDGIETEGPVLAGGRVGVGSVAHVPLAGSTSWSYEQPYMGRRPVLPYTPLGVATGPFLVLLGLSALGEPVEPEKRPALRYALVDRYVFAK